MGRFDCGTVAVFYRFSLCINLSVVKWLIGGRRLGTLAM